MKSGKKRTITQRSLVTTNEGNKKLNICTSPVSIPEAALTSPVGASQRNNTFQTNVTTIKISYDNGGSKVREIQGTNSTHCAC